LLIAPNNTIVSEALASYGYIAIFAIILLESAGVPLPGETTLIAASIYAGSNDTLDIRLIIATAAGATILGDNIGYWVGRSFARAAVLKWGGWIGWDQRKLDLGEFLFLRYGGKIVYLARFVAVLRVFAAVLAGVNRFPVWRFFMFNVLGGVTWAVLFGVAGYFLGQNLRVLAEPIGWLALVVAAVGLFFLWRFYKCHEARLVRQAQHELPALRQRSR
jgi:membrane protein DedA with SNARE-associated domain